MLTKETNKIMIKGIGAFAGEHMSTFPHGTLSYFENFSHF